MMTEDLSNIYEEAEKYLRTALSRWQRQLPEMYEDAFQEGMIQVWRDVEAGVTPKLKILRRASMAGNKFCHRNGEYFFGKPTKSREGITRDSRTLEKMKVFLEEYLPVHNNVYPPATVAAEALGIGRVACANALKRIREGRVDHMVYRPDGRMDWDYYKTMSVQYLEGRGEESSVDSRPWTDNPDVARYQHSFEDEAVSNVDVASLLNRLADGPREILYLYLYEQYNFNDLGRHRGHTANVSAKGNRLFLSAINQVKILLNPYEGECAAGHERSPETSTVEKRSDGLRKRVCTICRSANGNKTVAKAREGKVKMGRPPKLKCPQGHDKFEGRCKICRADAQRRYRESKK